MKLRDYLNSVKMAVGLLKVALGIGCLIIIVLFCVKSRDPLFLKIVLIAVIGLCAFFAFSFGFSDIKRSIIDTKELTKQERYERGMLLLGRVKGGKIQ